MISKITESTVETFAIELLENQGYRYIYGPDIAPDSEAPLPLGEAGVRVSARRSYEDVLLLDKLKNAVARINPTISSEVRDDAIKQIQRLASPELIANNEAFHRMLTEGIKVNYQKDGTNRGDLVWLVDWDNPENWHVGN